MIDSLKNLKKSKHVKDKELVILINNAEDLKAINKIDTSPEKNTSPAP